jgi:hypothetical protein
MTDEPLAREREPIERVRRALGPWLGRTLLPAAVLDPSGQASPAERQPQRLAVRRQLRQKTDPDAGRLLGVVFEAIVPVGVLETRPGTRRRRRTSAGRRRTPGGPRYARGCGAGAMDEHPRRHLVLRLERPHLTAVLVQEPLGCPPKRVREARRHGVVGAVRVRSDGRAALGQGSAALAVSLSQNLAALV